MMNGTVHQFEPTSDKQTALRRAFACFGTGVTVITTMTKNGPLGMTANSFSSISLDPALVLWSAAKSSKRHDAFAQAQFFCIHVLGADQRKMAEEFAKSGEAFDAHEWHQDTQGTPMLQGCLATFHCDTYATHPAGDHSLILGAVQQVTHAHQPRPGLMFDQGRFGQFTDAGKNKDQ